MADVNRRDIARHGAHRASRPPNVGAGVRSCTRWAEGRAHHPHFAPQPVPSGGKDGGSRTSGDCTAPSAHVVADGRDGHRTAEKGVTYGDELVSDAGCKQADFPAFYVPRRFRAAEVLEGTRRGQLDFFKERGNPQVALCDGLVSRSRTARPSACFPSCCTCLETASEILFSPRSVLQPLRNLHSQLVLQHTCPWATVSAGFAGVYLCQGYLCTGVAIEISGS